MSGEVRIAGLSDGDCALLTEAWRRMGEYARDTSEAMQALAPYLANDEARVAGLWARYYVRGALDPSYATPGLRDALVAVLLSEDVGHPDTHLLSPENRRLLAVAVMRGWAEHRPQSPDPQPLVWHRALGNVRVTVGIAS